MVFSQAQHSFFNEPVGRYDPDAAKQAVGDLDAAIRLTPLDPSAYVLRALVRIGAQSPLELTLGDLEKALELDYGHAGARRLVMGLEQAAREQRLTLITQGALDDEDRETIMGLARRVSSVAEP